MKFLLHPRAPGQGAPRERTRVTPPELVQEEDQGMEDATEKEVEQRSERQQERQLESFPLALAVLSALYTFCVSALYFCVRPPLSSLHPIPSHALVGFENYV